MHAIAFVTLMLSIKALACMNLTGKLSGDCIYQSAKYGNLDSFIEFDIQQPNCEQITIDGSKLSIPGEVEIKSTEGQEAQYTKLAMSWERPQKDILNFKYIYTAEVNGKKVDDVQLNGFFKQDGNGFFLAQTGTVDQDSVRIQCQLKK